MIKLKKNQKIKKNEQKNFYINMIKNKKTIYH
jgi:hypothetical protein